ncbi:MAG: hypothetical protein QF769_07145 [Candidatus Marinimicrobia bacterium]|jgi:hypothetical protein|nr:hypothetical protein [Candidatus Neomarinimicrobiota bacterium]|tara:strand:+ start:528 stop:782 length:255 start_codon:yes stop_codon:yes gene_type:complete
MTASTEAVGDKRESPKIRVYYFYPPFEDEPMAVIIPASQVLFNDGHFKKLYQRYESHNWTITEIKQKEKVYEETQIHPLTGDPV